MSGMKINKNCQAPGPGPGLDHWSLTWSTWSPTWPNLALANLVTNLTKPSLDLGKIWARSRHYNQTGHPTTKLFKGGNLEFLLSDCSEFQMEDQFNAIIKQAKPPYPPPPPPPWGRGGGGGYG